MSFIMFSLKEGSSFRVDPYGRRTLVVQIESGGENLELAAEAETLIAFARGVEMAAHEVLAQPGAFE